MEAIIVTIIAIVFIIIATKLYAPQGWELCLTCSHQCLEGSVE